MFTAVRLVLRVARSPLLLRVVVAYAAFTVTEYAAWIAVLVYAYGHGGVTAAGLVALAQLVPAAVAAPLFATIADRRSPVLLLTGGYALQALGYLAVATAIVANASPYVVYAGAIVASTAVSTTRPAQATLLPGLARDLSELTATNVLIGWVESVSVVVAGAGCGLLMTHGGVAPVAIVSTGLLVGAVLLVVRLPSVSLDSVGDEPVSALRHVADGVVAVRSNRSAALLVGLLGSEYIVVGALDVLFVVLALDILDHGQGWAGYLNSAFGLGGVCIGALATMIVGRRLGPIVLATAVALGVGLAATALVSGDVAVIALLVLVGGSHTLFEVAGRSLLQRSVSADMVARTFGLTEGLMMAGLATGSILVPALVAWGGGSLALFVVAAIVPLVVLVGARTLFRIDERAVPVVEISLLRSTPVFRDLPAPATEGLARALQRVEYAPGDHMIDQGDEGDRWYAIADGTVEIQQGGHHLRELGRGDAMGEIALLHGSPRTASAIARTPVTAYTLDRDSFLTAVTGHGRTHQTARTVVDEHHARDRERGGPPVDDDRG